MSSAAPARQVREDISEKLRPQPLLVTAIEQARPESQIELRHDPPGRRWFRASCQPADSRDHLVPLRRVEQWGLPSEPIWCGVESLGRGMDVVAESHLKRLEGR